MALRRLGEVGIEQAYNTDTGAMHLVRVSGLPGAQTVTDLGAIAYAVATGDIQIGAVEVKDGTTNDRAVVAAANTVLAAGLALAVADRNVADLLRSIDGAVADYNVLAGPDEVTVDNTATGKTLATLLGTALEAGMRRLTLVVQGTISWAAGNATVGVNDLVPGVYTLDVSKAVADTFKFIASTNTAVTVLQEG